MGTSSPGGPLGEALVGVHQRIDDGVRRLEQAATNADGDAAEISEISDALRRHIYFEEEHLFPRLRHGAMLPAIVVMEREHGAMWATLGALGAPGTESEGTQSAGALRTTLAEQLATHHPKEESTIYSHVDGVLGEDVSRELASLVSAAQMPEGWSCRQAPR